MFQYNKARCVAGAKALWPLFQARRLGFQGTQLLISWSCYGLRCPGPTGGGDTEEAKTKTKTGQEGERERGEDERQPAEVGTEMRRQYEIEEGREEGETRSTFPILPVLTQPLRHKVLRQQRGTRVSSTLTFTLAHAHMPRQLCPGLRTASCLLPPDPERQLSWGHSTVPAIIT